MILSLILFLKWVNWSCSSISQITTWFLVRAAAGGGGIAGKPCWAEMKAVHVIHRVRKTCIPPASPASSASGLLQIFQISILMLRFIIRLWGSRIIPACVSPVLWQGAHAWIIQLYPIYAEEKTTGQILIIFCTCTHRQNWMTLIFSWNNVQ